MTGKIGILVTHPIQYFAPLFRELSTIEKPFEFEVLYLSDFGLKGGFDREFGMNIKWDVSLCSGYSSRFFKNLVPKSLMWKLGFFGFINPRLLLSLARREYDGLIIFGWSKLSVLLAIYFCQLYGTKYIIRGEAALCNDRAFRKPKAFSSKIKRAILQQVFRNAAALLCIGSQNREFYKFYNVKCNKLLFSPYTVDHNLFPSDYTSDKRALSNRHGRKIIFGFVGKLVPFKRPVEVVKVFHSAFGHRDDVELWICGEGSCGHEIRRFIKERKIENIVLKGFVNQTRLPAIYKRMDILVLPSIAETWGLVVNEALSFGCFLLCTAGVGSAHDLIADGKNGMFIDMEEQKLAADSMRVACQTMRYIGNDHEVVAKKLDQFSLRNTANSFVSCCKIFGF